MYTLEQLQQKNLKDLKEIGWQLKMIPKDDQRRRQSWIDAIAGVKTPLLQLLEVSPAESVDRASEPSLESKFGGIVYPKSAAKPVTQNEELRPQLDRTQSADVHSLGSHPAKSDRDSSGVKTEALGSQEGDRVLAVARDCETDRGRVLPDQSIKLVNSEAHRLENEHQVQGAEYPRNARRDCPRCVGVQSLYQTRNFVMESWVIRCLYCDYERFKDPRGAYLAAPEPVHGPDEYPWKKEAILQASAYQAPPPSYTPPGDYCCTWEPIAQATKTSPGVDLIDDELPECCNCFGDGYTEDEFGSIKFCPCQTEPILSHQKTQGAIALAAKFSLDPKFDRNPILTGISLSDRFIARYSPPQSYNVCFQADTDGQLSLLDFEVELVNEPPDPDDFSSIDAFNDAMARWDAENAESLTVSMDSMCEWASCPHEWYEPKAEDLPLKASSMIEVVELSLDSGSITCNFSIPTFGAWCDRSDRSDEPPDT